MAKVKGLPAQNVLGLTWGFLWARSGVKEEECANPM